MTRQHRARHWLMWLVILPLTLGGLAISILVRPDAGPARESAHAHTPRTNHAPHQPRVASP